MDIKDAAQYFLSLNDPEAGGAITHLKLQKLCYYAQAYSLALNDEPLFDEEFQAWEHGPVSRTIFDRYRVNGFLPIEKPSDLPSIGEKEKIILNYIWDRFGKYDAMYLRDLTHQETPWLKSRGDCNEGDWCDNPIDEEEIKFYYKSKLYKEENTLPPKYNLDDLLKKVTAYNKPDRIELMDAPPIGDELL